MTEDAEIDKYAIGRNCLDKGDLHRSQHKFTIIHNCKANPIKLPTILLQRAIRRTMEHMTRNLVLTRGAAIPWQGLPFAISARLPQSEEIPPCSGSAAASVRWNPASPAAASPCPHSIENKTRPNTTLATVTR